MKQIIIYLWICVFSGVEAMSGDDDAHLSGADRTIPIQQMQPAPQELPGAIAYDALPEVTPEGLGHINEYLRINYSNLDEAQKREIFLYASTGNFSPSPWMNYFWRFVRTVSNPLHNLGMLTCAVIPMVSIYAEHERLNFIVSISAVSSIIFGKIDGYANDKIASHEELLLYLHAIQTHQQTQPQEADA
ncbi:MAG: hypothetical protein LBE95_01205 [Holosporaceae bacterium]|jgi:hypothetical protein|nr:hypothetical protein [Holosporaceae bacterium]